MTPSEFTVTGCVDCGKTSVLSKDEPKDSVAVFDWGGSAVRIWQDVDNKHHLIMVKSKPDRMFLSCQPFPKLMNMAGVAAILNFVERIKPEQEANNAVA